MKLSKILSSLTAAALFLSIIPSAAAFNFNLAPTEPNWIIVDSEQVEVGTQAEFILINTRQSANERHQYSLPEGWTISMEHIVDNGQWQVANNDQVQFDEDRRVFTYPVPEKADVSYYSIELMDENGDYVNNGTFEPVYNPVLFGIEHDDQRLIPGATYTVTTYSDATNQPATLPKGWGMKLEFQDGQYYKLSSNQFLGEENGHYTFNIPDTATEMNITIYNVFGAHMDSRRVAVAGAVPTRIASKQDIYGQDSGMGFYLYNEQDEGVALPEGWNIRVYNVDKVGYASTDGGGAPIQPQFGRTGYYYINFQDNWGTEGLYRVVVTDSNNEELMSDIFHIGEANEQVGNYNLDISTGPTYNAGQLVRVSIQELAENQVRDIPEGWELRLFDADAANGTPIYTHRSGMDFESTGTYTFPAPAQQGEYWLRLVESDGSTHITFRINVRDSISEIYLDKETYPVGQNIYFSLLDEAGRKVKISKPMEMEVRGPNGIITPTYDAGRQQYKVPAQQNIGDYSVSLYYQIGGENIAQESFSVVAAKMLAKISPSRIHPGESLYITISKTDQSVLDNNIRLQIYNQDTRITNIGAIQEREDLIIDKQNTSMTLALPIDQATYPVGQYTVKILDDRTGLVDDLKTFEVLQPLSEEVANRILSTDIVGLNFNATPIIAPSAPDDLEEPPEVPDANDPIAPSNNQAVETPALPCQDMPENHWAGPLLTELLSNNRYPFEINSEEINCRPDAMLTRERALAWILVTYYPEALQDLDDMDLSDLQFPDVDKNSKFAPYVKVGTELGIMVGNGDGTFSPKETIKRSEVLAIILRAKGVDLDNEPLNADYSPAVKYADHIPGAWFNNYIHYATQEGILSGRANPNGGLRIAAMNDGIRYAEAASLFNLVLFE